MTGRWELTNEQQLIVEPVLREVRERITVVARGMTYGAVPELLVVVLGIRAQWRELPEKYPHSQTCHRRFQQWIRSGKLEKALRLLAARMHEQRKLNLEEAFVDVSFASAEKGGFAVGPTRRGNCTKIVAVAARNSLPLAASV